MNSSPLRAASFFVLSLAASACSSSRVSAPHADSRAAVAAPEVSVAQALVELRTLEDARHPSVANFATHGSAEVRARAARALGRVLDAKSDALATLLADTDAHVRAEAAFAIGLRGEARFVDALLARSTPTGEPDANVRARAVEAASKLDAPETRLKVLAALADPDPRVRIEAAEGAGRWKREEAHATEVARALIARLEHETDAEVLTYGLFALDRRKSVDAVALFLRCASSTDPRQRIFAVHGLATLLHDQSLGMIDATSAIGVLLAHTDDADWRVACEAVPVFATSVDEEHEPIFSLAHSVANVRYATWHVVADWVPTSTDGLTVIGAANWLKHESAGALVDYEASPFVWAAAREAQIRIYARLLSDSQDLVPESVPFESMLVTQPLPESPVLLAGIARGLGAVQGEIFDRAIQGFIRHPNVLVAAAAIEALGKHMSPEHRATLREFLYHADNGLRLAALDALALAPQPDDLEHVAWAFDHSEGDIAPEVRFNALRFAGKVGGDAALALLDRGLDAREPFVRSVARQELARLAPERIAAHDADPARRPPATVVAAVELPTYARHPIVEMQTRHGVLRFELFPDEAPYHVHNFLTLAARGYYDGLTFHRVVPDFVVQGGDYRGDGNGGTTFRVRENVRELFAKGELVPHDSLRHEIGPRKFVRGSLGMPRNDDLDSGSSQFFVTHRETPHLDGRYTIFGELRDGFDALDAVEVGDVIEKVTIVDPGR
ncbi:MAG: peptidylprolyl isomerase [Planctomycetes bacterium]|nr:peptidylprolyl isomerase [Planctomycetota bacterium]